MADQEARLDHLTALVEGAAAAPAAGPAHQLVHPPPAPGPATRLRRLAGRLLRAPGAVMNRLRRAAESRWILPVADPAPPPSLALGRGAVAIEKRGRIADLPAGFLDLALLMLAAEDLQFLKLRGRSDHGGEDRELWLCRESWPWRAPEDLDRPLRRLPPGGPLLGRRLVLDGDPHGGATPLALAGLELRGEYWLRPHAPNGIAHAVKLGPPAGPATGRPGKVAVVTTRPLDGGLEVLAATLLRAAAAAGREAILLATFDLRASHRGLAETAPLGVPLYPLATFGPPELRGALLAHLLARESVTTLVQLGPGEGVFDQPALQEPLRRLRVIDLPLPQLPGSPLALGRPPGLALETLAVASLPFPAAVTAARPPGGSPARAAARQRLGAPAEAFLACQVADLVPGERPEDLVELAVRCPGIFFLQVGRGGLAGRRDDLARFRGVANLRCLAAADLAEVLDAVDVLLALGDPSLWPWPALAALERGVPVVGRAVGALARVAPRIAGGDSLAAMAAALEALRGGAAPAPGPLPASGPDLERMLADLLAP